MRDGGLLCIGVGSGMLSTVIRDDAPPLWLPLSFIFLGILYLAGPPIKAWWIKRREAVKQFNAND